MDFNTGAGGAGGSGGSPGSGGPSQRPPTGAAAEFTYTDPVQSFISAVRGVVLSPVDFYRGIRRQGDLLNPLIFAVICYEVYTLLGGILRLAGLGVEMGIGEFLGALVLGPLFAAVGLFIGAGILHLLVMLFVGSRNAGFEGTFRVVAYAAVTSLASWLPFIGWVVSLYGLYLAIVGVREVHTTTTGKAALVVLLPAAVILLLVLLLIAAGAALFFSLQQ
ncbi:MAG TPA: YIP1 family protein [Rubrobacteraceae bacterium]|nr:YIP1 family protein [Rubrobacteraceae bacterium]